MSNRCKDKYKNTVTYTLKCPVTFSPEDERILDGQSKICNWLYNHLYDEVEHDYKFNDGKKKLTNKYNLRNRVPPLKKEYPFLKTVYSSALKNTALRLASAYKFYFENEEIRHPHHRSWNKKWFSLEYETHAGWTIDGRNLILSLGKNKQNKQIRLTGILAKALNKKPKSFRIIKEKGKFYAIFTVIDTKIENKDGDRWIALDPNHKNLFTSIDYNGKSIEFQNLNEIKYWDEVIDNLKSKRDKCKRKSKFISTKGRRGYWQPSRRWIKYNDALKNAEYTKREQIKLGLFTISNYLCKYYDKILIGDYTPSTKNVPHKKGNRSMLLQTIIGKFRNILKWVAEKSGKTCINVDEKYTTMKCHNCGHMEKKNPSIRMFTCKCGKTLNRDINSAINIANKFNLSCTDYEDYKPSYTAYWNHKSNLQIN